MTKKRLAQLAKDKQKLRRSRDRKKLCRTCGRKAVKSKKTGRMSRSCRGCLKRDAARKAAASLRPQDRLKLRPMKPRPSVAGKIEILRKASRRRHRRHRDRDRNRTKRIDGELVRPLCKLSIDDGEKILRLSLPKYQRLLAAMHTLPKYQRALSAMPS